MEEQLIVLVIFCKYKIFCIFGIWCDNKDNINIIVIIINNIYPISLMYTSESIIIKLWTLHNTNNLQSNICYDNQFQFATNLEAKGKAINARPPTAALDPGCVGFRCKLNTDIPWRLTTILRVRCVGYRPSFRDLTLIYGHQIWLIWVTPDSNQREGVLMSGDKFHSSLKDICVSRSDDFYEGWVVWVDDKMLVITSYALSHLHRKLFARHFWVIFCYKLHIR